MAGKQEQACSRLVMLYSLTWRSTIVLYGKKIVLVAVKHICTKLVSHCAPLEILQIKFPSIPVPEVDLCSSWVWGHESFEAFPIYSGERGCMDVMAIEGDKIFNQVTSCTKSGVGIHYLLSNHHFISDSSLELVRNCIFSALVII